MEAVLSRRKEELRVQIRKQQRKAAVEESRMLRRAGEDCIQEQQQLLVDCRMVQQHLTLSRGSPLQYLEAVRKSTFIMENNYRLNETSVPSILHEILQSASASRAERGEALWILTNLRCAKNYSPNYISDQVAIQLLEEDDEEMLDNVAWYLRTLALRSEGVDWLAGSTALLLKQKLLRVQSKKTLALLLSVVSAVLQRKVSEQTATYFIKPIFNSLCNQDEAVRSQSYSALRYLLLFMHGNQQVLGFFSSEGVRQLSAGFTIQSSEKCIENYITLLGTIAYYYPKEIKKLIEAGGLALISDVLDKSNGKLQRAATWLLSNICNQPLAVRQIAKSSLWRKTVVRSQQNSDSLLAEHVLLVLTNCFNCGSSYSLAKLVEDNALEGMFQLLEPGLLDKEYLNDVASALVTVAKGEGFKQRVLTLLKNLSFTSCWEDYEPKLGPILVQLEIDS